MDLAEYRESIERECKALDHMSKSCIELAGLVGRFDRRELDLFFEADPPIVALLARMERQMRDGAENLRRFRRALIVAKGSRGT